MGNGVHEKIRMKNEYGIQKNAELLLCEIKKENCISPERWHKPSENFRILSLYCSLFTVVVVRSLKVIISCTRKQFSRHIHNLYPLLCRLIRVRSDEIRKLVADIMLVKVSPLLGL